MTSYAIAIEEEIAKLKEKMSKLQIQKVEEETQKEEAKKNEEKQKQKEKRNEEMSKEAIEYEDMMIIQKVYPKFFTITANWNKTAIRNPEYEKYYNEISKKIKEFLTNDYFPTLESVYQYCKDTPSIHRNVYVPNLFKWRSSLQVKCLCCNKQFPSCENLLIHMEKKYNEQEFISIGGRKRRHGRYMELLCNGRYEYKEGPPRIVEKSVLESTEYYKVLNELKKICIEPPPLYLGRLEGSSSPKYIYDDVIVDKAEDLDTNISVFIDMNPQYRVTPINDNKYMFQCDYI